MFEFDFEQLEEEESPREKFQPGEVLRSLSPAVMREEASLQSQALATLPAGARAQVLLCCGRRLLVALDRPATAASHMEGWLSCEALDGTILWERVGKVEEMDDGPPNVEIRPFREADRPWLRIIEAHAFSSGEQCLDMWLRDATAEGSRTSVDVAAPLAASWAIVPIGSKGPSSDFLAAFEDGNVSEQKAATEAGSRSWGFCLFFKDSKDQDFFVFFEESKNQDFFVFFDESKTQVQDFFEKELLSFSVLKRQKIEESQNQDFFVFFEKSLPEGQAESVF
eukprot:s171_g40.t1